MVYLTFVSEFNAVHRLWNSNLTEAENLEMFAECANPSGHGHLYRVEITCAADVNPARPVVLERKTISELVDSVLAPKLRDANLDTVFGVKDFVSTGENVTRAIWQSVEPHIPKDTSLVAVRVIETPKNSFAYFGESGPPRASEPMT
jgi:6-pyruvoyltetrahydropterin/6-carboxytetrahydropterin synthase